MNNINITDIIIAVIGVLATIITTFVVPYIKTKITIGQYNALKIIATTAVKGAEALYIGKKRGEEKRDYVLNCIKEQCNKKGFTFDETELRNALEDAWFDINN